MQSLLKLKTKDWELVVWSKPVANKQTRLAHTLAHRNKILPLSEIRFSEPVLFYSDNAPVVEGEFPFWRRFGNQECRAITLPKPLFFENTLYEFEFIFKAHVTFTDAVDTHPKVCHKLNKVNDVFRFSNRGVPVLQGTIAFKNDIGWFKLPIAYWVKNKQKNISISLEVLPTKIDMEADLDAIYKVLDNQYPLWRFALAESTEQSVDRTREKHEPFELLWIAEFESLRHSVEKGIKQILSAPHSRLLPETKKLKADRLKGKLPTKLAEKVRQDISAGQTRKRYAVTQKKLSADTPENQFIQFVLSSLQKRLKAFSQKTRQFNEQPEQQCLSESFFQEIQSWIQPLEHFQNNPLFKELSTFKGLNGESLVLQQKTGYSAVYKAWQQLKWYLGVLGNQATVSMKTIEELYEIWCFLEVKRLLIEDLGFEEQATNKGLLYKKDLTFDIKNGNYGSFKMSRPDGIVIVLKHEPLFKNQDLKEGIRVWTASQKPDILLEITFKNGEQFVWLFDAKYRIKPPKNVKKDGQKESIDWVPDDALNQMHRYRDALFYQDKQDSAGQTRPVFGAYALYPGYFEQSSTASNPYQEAINKIDIGAFPLLPSQPAFNGSLWLSNFLKEKIGTKQNVYSTALSDHLYLQDSARIPYRGLSVNKENALTMTIALGKPAGRESNYLKRFEEGLAEWYHVPVKTIKDFQNKIEADIEHTIMHELQFVAIATRSFGPASQSIEWVWPVKSVSIKKRRELTLEQTGRAPKNNKDYWLLELGAPFKLRDTVINVPSASFMASIKLTTLIELTESRDFKKLKAVYTALQV
ncbi:MAG: restriction endonuclease-like protein [Thiotrichales bacterium]|nr:restriction endonuclease-like protein [Thiotrichales bacterium]